MIDVSCGVLIVSPSNQLLVAHTTNAGDIRGWTIPKGIRDEGETSVAAAVRELWEETGIDLRGREDRLEVLGEYTYLKEKNIFLTVYRAGFGEFDCTKLDCTSMFESKSGPQKEVDKYKFVDFDRAVERDLSRTLAALLGGLKDRIVA